MLLGGAGGRARQRKFGAELLGRVKTNLRVPLGTLFLEATQLKTVRTVTVALRADPSVAEAQVVGIAARSGRRPTEPVDADAIQRTVGRVAVARGRVLLGTPTGPDG